MQKRLPLSINSSEIFFPERRGLILPSVKGRVTLPGLQRISRHALERHDPTLENGDEPKDADDKISQ
jgi:hypothetical protein